MTKKKTVVSEHQTEEVTQTTQNTEETTTKSSTTTTKKTPKKRATTKKTTTKATAEATNADAEVTDAKPKTTATKKRATTKKTTTKATAEATNADAEATDAKPKTTATKKRATTKKTTTKATAEATNADAEATDAKPKTTATKKRATTKKTATKTTAEATNADAEATDTKPKTTATKKRATTKKTATKTTTETTDADAEATDTKPKTTATKKRATTKKTATKATAETTNADTEATDTKPKTTATKKRATTKKTAAKTTAEATNADAEATDTKPKTTAQTSVEEPSLEEPNDLPTEAVSDIQVTEQVTPNGTADIQKTDAVAETVTEATTETIATIAEETREAEDQFYEKIRQQTVQDRQDKREQLEKHLHVARQYEHSTEERLILEQLKRLGRPVHTRKLETSFTRNALNRIGGWRRLEQLLDKLVRRGDVVQTRKKTYGLPEAMNLVRGRFQAKAGGFGFLIPDAGGDDYFVPEGQTLEAWNGDTVLVRIEGSERQHRYSGGHGRYGQRGGQRGGHRSGRDRRGDFRTRASVIRIVDRAFHQLVGSLEFYHGYPVLKPDDFRARHRIFIHLDESEDIQHGDRVVAELFWPEDTGEDEVFGQVVQVLGDADDTETETKAVIVKYNLHDEFPAEVIEQAKAIPLSIPDEVIAERLDLREYNTFTVDGSDAKDFDDAIHIRPTEQGHFEVGIHVADVSHYVRPNTPLDTEAYARATSVYLPSQVLPMLPEHLSNGVCSLIPYQDRLTMTTLVELNGDAEIVGVTIRPSVIHSKARLTYDEVQAYSEARAALPEHARSLEGDMHLLLKMTTKLRQQRLREGALDFKLREVKVDIGQGGKMQLIPIREETARGMVEDLMLLANKAVARFLLEHNVSTLFRVHEEPTLQNFQDATAALGRVGLAFPGGEPTPKAYQAVLQEVRGTPRESMVNTLLLRSMQQARYAEENLGHFGLAFEEYLHFTSPIRRYPDLVVHRNVKALLASRSAAENSSSSSDSSAITVPSATPTMAEMAQHTSGRARNAEEAERDLTKYYQCKWAEEHLGESFDGVVSGVVSTGLFIILENGIEGKIHISYLDDDYYHFIENAQILKGRNTGQFYRLGDRVHITIHETKPLARQIDFVLADPNDPDYLLGTYTYTSTEESDMTDESPNSNETSQHTAESDQTNESRIRARRREDRERERQAQLQDLPLNTPKFTLEDDEPAKPRTTRSTRSTSREGRPTSNRRNTQSSRRPTSDRSASDRPTSGRARIVTVHQSRNEHLRPVNMTVQRMYFGDWTSENLPAPTERSSRNSSGSQGRRGHSRSHGSSHSSNRARNSTSSRTRRFQSGMQGGSDRTERRAMRSLNGASNVHRTAETSASGSSKSASASSDERRRRNRRRRRSDGGNGKDGSGASE